MRGACAGWRQTGYFWRHRLGRRRRTLAGHATPAACAVAGLVLGNGLPAVRVPFLIVKVPAAPRGATVAAAPRATPLGALWKLVADPPRHPGGHRRDAAGGSGRGGVSDAGGGRRLARFRRRGRHGNGRVVGNCEHPGLHHLRLSLRPLSPAHGFHVVRAGGCGGRRHRDIGAAQRRGLCRHRSGELRVHRPCLRQCRRRVSTSGWKASARRRPPACSTPCPTYPWWWLR